MNFNRRNLAGTTALIASGAALAACGVIDFSNVASVEQAIANTQAVLSYLGPIVPLLAVFVPGATSFVPDVEAGLSAASDLLNTLVASMKEAQAQPIVGQISAALKGAIAAAMKAASLISNASQRATVVALLNEASVIVGLLIAFANGVADTVKANTMMRSMATRSHLRVRYVRQ